MSRTQSGGTLSICTTLCLLHNSHKQVHNHTHTHCCAVAGTPTGREERQGGRTLLKDRSKREQRSADRLVQVGKHRAVSSKTPPHREKRKTLLPINTVFEHDKGQRASMGVLRAGGVLRERSAWFLRVICDVLGLSYNR